MNIVKDLRIRAGMQQKELALLVGVSRPTVSEWESGKKNPSGERLRKLTEIFGVDAGTILGYEMPEILIRNQVSFRGLPQNTTEEKPKTEEARFISGGVDLMPPEERAKAKIIMTTLFGEYFKERKEDDTEL